MAQTLRRSKSKYGRTRRQRQHNKQTRMRGGFSFTEFIGKFTPKTDKEKCKAAKEAAQTACSNVDGDIEMMPISDTVGDGASSIKPVGEAPVGDYTSSTKPVGEAPVDDYTSSIKPVVGSVAIQEDDDDYNTKFDTLQTQPQLTTEIASFGGAKKSKKRNKKRSQGHRKKHKSRKHKK